jgi:hypothetical protein
MMEVSTQIYLPPCGGGCRTAQSHSVGARGSGRLAAFVKVRARKSNLLVAVVEYGVVLPHEVRTENPVVEALGLVVLP